MNLRIIFLITVLFTMLFSSFAHARKPAVEDFVGVETEDYQPTTSGTEVLFNFGNHLTSKDRVLKDNSSTLATFTLIAFILLPFMMWFGISKANEQKQSDENSTTKIDESQVQNVTHLSDYKKDHSDDDIKKAS
jgi:hypothetical protein